jgi:hypothetical protein
VLWTSASLPTSTAGEPPSTTTPRSGRGARLASVYADGSLDTVRTAGITSVNKGPTGVYCVNPSSDVSVHSVSVTPTSETGPLGLVIATASILSHVYCGPMIEVRTYTPQPTAFAPADQAFMLIIA